MKNKRPPEDVDASLDVDGVRHGGRALVLKPVLRNSPRLGGEFRDPETLLAEAVGLAQAIDLDVIEAAWFNLPNPSPAALLGSGLVEEWAGYIKEEEVELVILDHMLTPIQQRNLEKAWNAKVIDRTGLILEIFGARARTKEGKLQVELAALNYQKSRLVRSWTHLERQRGGFGFMGGPGESQLEIDRRLITGRIMKLKDELEQVRRTRGLGRDARGRAEHPTVALVGYTNAGKSTLFNKLTGAKVLVKDMLFATLDPSMRGLTLPSGRKVILSDTVGFITDLPTHLVEAFRATLEEVQQAAVILHVRDVTHPEARMQKEAVEEILTDLGIAPDDKRLIEVMNKADLLPEEERAPLRAFAQRQRWESQHALPVEGHHPGAFGGSVAISALNGDGLDDLLNLIDELLASEAEVYSFEIPVTNGAALAWIYGHGQVLQREDKKSKIKVTATMDQANYGRFLNKFPNIPHVKD